MFHVEHYRLYVSRVTLFHVEHARPKEINISRGTNVTQLTIFNKEISKNLCTIRK